MALPKLGRATCKVFQGLACAALALVLSPLAHDGSAQAQPVTSSDHFEIALINTYDLVWHDAGTGAKRDVYVLRPIVPPGYFALGDIAVAGNEYEYRNSKPPFTIALHHRPSPQARVRASVSQA